MRHSTQFRQAIKHGRVISRKTLKVYATQRHLSGAPEHSQEVTYTPSPRVPSTSDESVGVIEHGSVGHSPTSSHDFSKKSVSNSQSDLVLLADKDMSSDSVKDPVQVGFIVSRAVGGAVVRNRIKRWLRASARTHFSLFANFSLVVIRVKPEAARQSHSLLERDLVTALKGISVR